MGALIGSNVSGGNRRVTGHLPVGYVSGLVALPDQVLLPRSIQYCGSNDLPLQRNPECKVVIAACPCGAAHVPVYDIACGGVLPNELRLPTAAVNIGHGDGDPGQGYARCDLSG